MDMATSRRQQALAERGGCGTECDRIQACATGTLEPKAQMVLTDDIRIDQAVARCDQDWVGVAWAEGACTRDVLGKPDGGARGGNDPIKQELRGVATLSKVHCHHLRKKRAQGIKLPRSDREAGRHGMTAAGLDNAG